MVSRDYLSIKVWDLHMEARPVECYPVSVILLFFVDGVHTMVLIINVSSCSRFTSICVQSCVHSTKTTAFSTSLSAAGTARTQPL